jgi:hypothetical protein
MLRERKQMRRRNAHLAFSPQLAPTNFFRCFEEE